MYSLILLCCCACRKAYHSKFIHVPFGVCRAALLNLCRLKCRFPFRSALCLPRASTLADWTRCDHILQATLLEIPEPGPGPRVASESFKRPKCSGRPQRHKSTRERATTNRSTVRSCTTQCLADMQRWRQRQPRAVADNLLSKPATCHNLLVTVRPKRTALCSERHCSPFFLTTRYHALVKPIMLRSGSSSQCPMIYMKDCLTSLVPCPGTML